MSDTTTTDEELLDGFGYEETEADKKKYVGVIVIIIDIIIVTVASPWY